MIRHIVFWKLQPQAEGQGKAANMQRIKAEMEALSVCIPSIRHLEVRPNLRVGDEEFDLMLYSEFDEAAGLQVYLDHPAHLAAAAFVAKVRSGETVFDGLA